MTSCFSIIGRIAYEFRYERPTLINLLISRKVGQSAITYNEDMKGNAKCTNFHFEPPLEDRGNAQGLSMARWKARCRLPIN